MSIIRDNINNTRLSKNKCPLFATFVILNVKYWYTNKGKTRYV